MMKILNTRNYFCANSLMHNNPKVRLKKTSKRGNENISIKCVLTEEAESGGRGKFPMTGELSERFIFKLLCH